MDENGLAEPDADARGGDTIATAAAAQLTAEVDDCLLYTSDAADERSSVDLGGRRIIQKKKREIYAVRRR